MRLGRAAAVLATACALDLAFGDLPNSVHPVARFGSLAARLAQRLPRDGPLRDGFSGVAMATILPLAACAAGAAGEKVARRLPGAAGVLLEALLLKQCFAVRGLFSHGAAVRRALDADDLPRARAAAGQIVSRDTRSLAASSVASAAIESLAENASDSAVAPWLWWAIGGLPAAAAYRAFNTLDAMIGYRSEGCFGTPVARVDDLLNLLPARITAAALLAPARFRPGAVAGTRKDARRTPSPNSGWPMAAASQALGVRLEKPGHHILNHAGRPPTGADITRAQRLAGVALVLCAALVAIWTERGR